MSWHDAELASRENEWFSHSQEAEGPGPARIIRKREAIREAKRLWSTAEERRAGQKCLIRKVYNHQYCKVSFLDEEGEWEEHTYLLPLKLLRQDATEVEMYHYHYDANHMDTFLESVEADRVDIFDVLAFAPWVLSRNSWIKALMCMFIQIVVPVILIAATITQLLHPGGTKFWQWNGICSPKEAWSNPRILLKIANKITSVALLMYTYNYTTKFLWELNTRPMVNLLKSETCYKRLEKPRWAIFGLLTNALSLAVCGLASIFVIFVSESILDTVLNAFAIFFLNKIDDEILDRIDLDRFKEYIQAEVDALKQPSQETQQCTGELETPCTFKARNRPIWFGKAWAFAIRALQLVSVFVAIAVPYVAVCKVGVEGKE